MFVDLSVVSGSGLSIWKRNLHVLFYAVLFCAVGEKSKLGGRIEWWKADGVSFH